MKDKIRPKMICIESYIHTDYCVGEDMGINHFYNYCPCQTDISSIQYSASVPEYHYLWMAHCLVHHHLKHVLPSITSRVLNCDSLSD